LYYGPQYRSKPSGRIDASVIKNQAVYVIPHKIPKARQSRYHGHRPGSHCLGNANAECLPAPRQAWITKDIDASINGRKFALIEPGLENY
jgi:hypothetical protein